MARNIDSILKVVTGLLAKAEASKFPEEAKTLREKAQEMMQKYRLEEEQLIAQDPGSIEPILVEFPICKLDSPFRSEYLNLMWYIAGHSDVLATYKGDWHGTRMVIAQAVGYEGDARQTEFLFNAVKLAFAESLEPQIDSALSEAVNIYRLRQAGIERQRIARMMWGEEIGSKSSAHAKVGKIYKAECERRGEAILLDGRGISLNVFKESYAREFVWRIVDRLRDARDAVDGTFGAVTLAGRKERVQEAFWTHFPKLRPEPKTEVAVPEKAPAKKKAPKPRRISAAAIERENRRYHSAAAQAGGSAGRDAADTVELTRQPRQGKLEDDFQAEVQEMRSQIGSW